MELKTMTRADLEAEILADASLYAQFDEARLMASGYTDDEMRAVIQKWIEDGDETELASVHTQDLSDIVLTVRHSGREPEVATILQMAQSLCGSLLTPSVQFAERQAAFLASGKTLAEIAKIAQLELDRRIGIATGSEPEVTSGH